MRIRWGRVLVAFFILELIICGIIYMIIDFKTKQEINIIKNSYKAHTSEIMFDEINNTQRKTMFVYEPQNEVRIDVCSDGVNKTYMDYKKITNKSSKQYQFIKANMTVDEKGYLRDEKGYIGVALGTYFGEIGTRYIFKLSSGTEIKVIKVEVKDDAHTNNGCEQKWDKSVIEFVIDTEIAEKYYGLEDNGYINNGNFNNIFKGEIVEITRITE